MELNLLITLEILKLDRYFCNEWEEKYKNFEIANVRWVLTYQKKINLNKNFIFF